MVCHGCRKTLVGPCQVIGNVFYCDVCAVEEDGEDYFANLAEREEEIVDEMIDGDGFNDMKSDLHNLWHNEY